jgi:hypothetical protein
MFSSILLTISLLTTRLKSVQQYKITILRLPNEKKGTTARMAAAIRTTLQFLDVSVPAAKAIRKTSRAKMSVSSAGQGNMMSARKGRVCDRKFSVGP